MPLLPQPQPPVNNPPEGGFGFGFFHGLVSGISDLIGTLTESTPTSPKPLHFGRPLEESYNTALEKCQVHISLLCISYLEKNVEEEGLFRIPGSNTIALEWKQIVDSGVELDFKGASPHDVASFLKLYLRELPDGLISTNYFARYCSLGETQHPDIDTLAQLVTELPLTNKLVLYKFVSLLNNIASQSAINKMTAANLSVCLATNVLKEPETEISFQTVLQHTTKLQKVFQVMINESAAIWEKVQLH